MKRIFTTYIIGLFLVILFLFSPLVIRELKFDKIEFTNAMKFEYPSFDFHVKKDSTRIIEIANLSLQGIYKIETLTSEFSPIKSDLESMWHDDSLTSNNTHQLYIHSLVLLWDLYYAHKYTKNDDYLDKGLEILSSWIKHNNRWKPTEATYVWFDHSTAERTIAILNFWDYLNTINYETHLYDNLISDYCNQAVIYLTNPQNYIIQHNHGIFEDIALMMLSYHISEPSKASKYSKIAINRFSRQIEFAFSDNGMHLENSPGYHFVVTNLAQYFLDLASLKNGSLISLAAKINRAQKLKSLLIMPDGKLPPIGDTNPNDKVDTEKRLYTTIADTLAGCFISSSYDQYVYARVTGVSKIHSHSDPLSFIYGTSDGLVISETGFLSYQNNKERAYTKSYLAHNGVFPHTFEHDFDKVAIINKLSSETSIKYSELIMLSELGNVQREFFIDDIKNELVVIDSIWETSISKWYSVYQLSENAVNVVQVNKNNVQFEINNSIYTISSNSDLTIIEAQNNPMIGWHAKPLVGLFPVKTVIAENIYGRRTITKISNQYSLLNNSLNCSSENYKVVRDRSYKIQIEQSVNQREKILWGTQYSRRVYVFNRIFFFLTTCFIGVMLLYIIKRLRRYLQYLILLPNIGCLMAIIYLIVRHIN